MVTQPISSRVLTTTHGQCVAPIDYLIIQVFDYLKPKAGS